MVSMWTQRRITNSRRVKEPGTGTIHTGASCHLFLPVFICVQPWVQGGGFSEMERLTSICLEGARILWESKKSRCRTGKKLIRTRGQ